VVSSQLTHDLALLARLATAAAACGCVGAERQFRGHEAGLRTYGLVGLGSAGLMALSSDAFPSGDRVLAGIITGVGFLGAGMLFRAGEHVRNLTSATASWACAAVGAMLGVGRYALGLGMVALILFLLEQPYIPGLGRLDPAGRGVDDPPDRGPRRGSGP
jgi:putative Mg2+ transporter-C (MgtC) family protein